ncbi:MAG: hypothetical protein ACOYJ1_12775 [Peptococcales bacterium]|jgi:hypothetical protein
MWRLMGGVLLILLIFLSVRSKIILNRRRTKELPEVISSPVSQALTQLLGTAGGIYLSLIMLASFLGIDVPKEITFWQWSLDPLAFFSLLITLLQPLLIRGLQKI